MRNFIEKIQKHSREYGSLPFWSWNDKLEENELRRQIQRMYELGMNGFFMHARGGLETEYLSDEWFDAVNACTDEAKKLGMEAWSYDENGWPSGFAGGVLLEDERNHATFLSCETTNEFPADYDEKIVKVFPNTNHSRDILGVYYVNDGKIIRIQSNMLNAQNLSGKIGENDFDNSSKPTEYIVIRQRWDSSFVDTLDKTITEKFLAATHDEYKKRISDEDFGKTMPGFFTDEPQYYRWGTVWSDTMPREFEKEYGYNVLDNLPVLFMPLDKKYVDDDEFRYDYWRLCHKLFINHWIKPVYDWCELHGCRVTGHAVEETTLSGQMWCCGGIMPFYEYEHIPGIDYLGRGLADDVASKQLGSACAQLGKKKALSEMFACCGWDVTPRELKRIAELQYANGVNVMCQHLYAYSIRGQRKRDYPANYSEHLPWQEHMKAFNSYFNNLGCILAQGEELADTLVIHPIHSAYLTYRRNLDYNSIKTLEDDFHRLSNILSNSQIAYHWGDESMMAKMSHVEKIDINANNGEYGAIKAKLTLGKCAYSYVIIPTCDTLDSSTVQLLKEFIAFGGKVLCWGVKPTRIDGRTSDMSWLENSTSLDEILAASISIVKTKNGDKPKHMRQMIRETESGRLIYLVNLSDDDENEVSIAVKNVESLCEINVETLEIIHHKCELSGGRCIVKADFEPSQSRVFIENKSDNVEFSINAEMKENVKYAVDLCKNDCKKVKLVQPFEFVRPPENQFTIDKFALSLDGGNTYSSVKPIECIRDNLLRSRFKGRIGLKAYFNVDEIPDSLEVVVEPMKNAECIVNGKKVNLDGGWRLDRSFKTADILPMIRVGVNEIETIFDYYQRDYVYYVLYGGVSESLRNCLAFDTEIECIYLWGRFALKTSAEFVDGEKRSCVYQGNEKDFAIIRQKREIDPVNFVTANYPFFAGTMEIKTNCDYKPGDATILKLGGRYAICRVKVNGNLVKTLMFTEKCDLSGFLREGKNEIILELTNSNRNLLGPHHGHDPEPYGVGPGTFSMENSWNGENCPHYVDRYAFVRFGIDVN